MKRPSGFSLMDLVKECIRYWKILVVFIIVGVVGASGYTIVHNKQEAKKVPVETEVEYSFTDDEMDNIEILQKYQDLYTKYEDYNNRSELMKIDSKDVKQDVLLYAVKGNSNADLLVESVSRMLASDDFLLPLAEQMEVEEASYLSELIKVAKTSDSGAEDESNFTITIRHYDELACKNITEYIKKYMENVVSKLELGEDSYFTLAEDNYGSVVDTQVLDTQKNSLLNEINNRNSYMAALTKLSESQRDYFEGNTTYTSIVNAANYYSIKKNIAVCVLAVLLCFVGGTFVSLCFNRKILESDDLGELYGLDEFNISNKKDLESLAIIIAYAIKKLMNDGRSYQIVISGKRIGKRTKKLEELLQKQMDDEKIVCKSIVSMVEKEKINEESVVLFLEDIRKSSYAEINTDIMCAKAQNTRILGIVAL